MSQQSFQSHKSLTEAIKELNGHWFGYNSNALFYDHKSQTYVFSDPDNYPTNNDIEMVCDFRRYSAAIAAQGKEQPVDFSWRVAPVTEKHSDTQQKAFYITSENLQFVSGKQETMERVALLGQNDSEFLVLTAVFSDKMIDANGGPFRATMVKPNACGVGQKLLNKKSVMLIDERGGVTPWGLQKLRSNMRLPQALQVKFLYSPENGQSTTEVVQKNADGEVVLLGLNNSVPMAIELIEQHMRKREFQGDSIQVRFDSDQVKKIENDEGLEFAEWETQVDIALLHHELYKAVQFFVADALSGAHVDVTDLHEPLMHVLKTSQTTELGEYKPVDSVEIEFVLHCDVLATPELTGVVKDSVIETVPGAKGISVTANRLVERLVTIEIEAAYASLVEKVGAVRANRELPFIFEKHGLSIDAAFRQQPASVREELLGDLTVNRRLMISNIAETALAQKHMQHIAAGLPVQKVDQQLVIQDPAAAEDLSVKVGMGRT